MLRSSRLALLSPTLVLAFACAPGPRIIDWVDEPEELEPELVGPLTRSEIEAAVPGWVIAEIEAAPDPEAAVAMAAAGEGSRVTVYLGTWCSDSKRELARFWRAIDEAGGEIAFELAYVGVNRDKNEPAASLEGLGLEYVPTFVVETGGEETGRIVEESPAGIEHDLGALLRGEAAGLITAKEELLEP